MTKYDLFIIGAGSGGIAAAKRAVAHGAKVAISEYNTYGGTCVGRGCIPKKLFCYAALYPDLIKEAKFYGWTSSKLAFNWSILVTNKDKEINRLINLYKKTLKDINVDLYKGVASIINERTISVENKKISAKKILIATGGTPLIPDIEGKENIITSDNIFNIEKLPKKIAIIGSGYIGTELSSILNGLGCKVTMFARDKYILKGFDQDLVNNLTQMLVKQGIEIRRNETITSITKLKNNFKIITSKKNICNFDLIMAASGRKPNTAHLQLENADIKISKNGAIATDDYFQTSTNGIFAIGDVSNKVNLTPVAVKEGKLFADREFAGASAKICYNNIPTAVFSRPEIASVGMSEEKAIEEGIDFSIFKTSFKPLKYALTDKNDKIFAKLIVDKKTDRILGFHMMGVNAAEIIQIIAIAITSGLTKKQFNNTYALHPSISEEFVLM